MNWILLRGLARQSAHWDDFPALLEEQPGVDQVVKIDQPGFGTQSDLRFSTKMSNNIKDLQKQFEELPKLNDKPWSILGLSMGGMIALDWVSKYPKQFKNVVVINSSLKGSSSLSHRLRPSAAASLVKLILSKDIKKREHGVLKLTSHMQQHRIELVDKWVKVEEASPLKIKNILSQLFISASYKGPKKINTRLLVLSGLSDKLVNPISSEKIAKKYNGVLKSHSNAGHDLPLDDSKWVVEQIVNFQRDI